MNDTTGADRAALRADSPSSRFHGSVLLRKALACPTEPLNQAAVALQLGVSQQTVSNWVSGRSRPSPESMLGLERIFGIDPRDWLRSWTPDGARASAGGAPIKEVA